MACVVEAFHEGDEAGVVLRGYEGLPERVVVDAGPGARDPLEECTGGSSQCMLRDGKVGMAGLQSGARGKNILVANRSVLEKDENDPTGVQVAWVLRIQLMAGEECVRNDAVHPLGRLLAQCQGDSCVYPLGHPQAALVRNQRCPGSHR